MALRLAVPISPIASEPEPHPVDYDWRFSETTATNLADLLDSQKGAIACLGSPTLFSSLKKRGRRSVLIDRNRYLSDSYGRQGVQTLDILTDPPLPEMLFDVVFMDPPWYPDHMHWWLAWASRIVAENGFIFSTVFPPWTRPTAGKERSTLFQVMERMGKLANLDLILQYETPLFEAETYKVCKVERGRSWRTGQLVVIEAANRAPYPERPREQAWRRFLFGTQVVMLRERRDVNLAPPVLVPIYRNGCKVLRSVSRRHRPRRRIDLWTSRNRVFSISGNATALRGSLAALAGPSLTERKAMTSSVLDIFTLRELLAET